MEEKEDLVVRLRKRAEIRRNIKTRKSVAEGAPDRISDLLEEAALIIESQHELIIFNGQKLNATRLREEKLGERLKDAIDTLEFYSAGIPFAEKLLGRLTNEL